MSDNDFLNRTAPEDHIQEDYEYPTIQWNNGLPGASGALANGGFELPLKGFKDLVAGEILDIPHRNGTVTELGYLLPIMSLAIVQSHTAYYRENGDNLEWSPVPRFEEGYRSRTLYFCYAAEIETSTRMTPVILSVKSKVAQEFKALLRSFRSQILAAADRLSNSRSAHYFYYVPVGSNGRETMEGGPLGSFTIAPPTPYWDVAIDDLVAEAQVEILRELAIPDYLYQHIISAGWNEASAWRENLEQRGPGNGNGNDTPPPPPAQDPPISPTPPPPTPIHNEPPTEPEAVGWEAPPITDEPPMTEAEAVGAAQAGAPPTMTEAQAHQAWRNQVGPAIRSGIINASEASRMASKATHSGWINAIEALQQRGSMVAA